MLPSDGFEAFLAVARSGGFSAGARALNLSQSAVSQRVAALEEALGATLFVRLPRGVKLTATGEALLAHGRVLEASEAEFLATLDRPKRGRTPQPLAGVARVAGFSSVLRSLVLPAIAPLARAHPDVRLDLRSAELGALRTLFLQGETDFVILDTPLSKAGVFCEKLGEETNVLVVARAHAPSGKLLSPVRAYLDHDADDEVTERFRTLQKSKPLPSAPRHFLDDIHGLLDGARQGLGAAVAPLHLVVNDAALTILEGYEPLRVPLWLHGIESVTTSRLHAALRAALRAGIPALLEGREI